MANTSPDLNPTSLADVHPPEHLAQRLAAESREFGKNVSPDALSADLAAHEQRHQAHLQHKAAHGHDEVEHAKAVAASHASNSNKQAARGTDNVAQELESGVEAKRKSLERQQAELDDLSEKLKRADEVERALRAQLGEA
ncbi:hypothetical protein JCM10207_001950 [Rhodosporidiobolus poonsookiae]